MRAADAMTPCSSESPLPSCKLTPGALRNRYLVARLEERKI